MEDWRQREELERAAREAREAKEAEERKRREAEQAERAAAKEREKVASQSRQSRSSRSSSRSRSRSRRRRRSSSSSCTSSRGRRKTGWDVTDDSLVAQAGPQIAEVAQIAKVVEAKARTPVIPPPPPIPCPCGDTSLQPPQAPALAHTAILQKHVQPPPPPPPPANFNGALLNAPVCGQMWEQVPLCHQDLPQLSHSQLHLSAGQHQQMASSTPVHWSPHVQHVHWQHHVDGKGHWNQVHSAWSACGWPGHPAAPAHPSTSAPFQASGLPGLPGLGWTPDRWNEEERFIGRVKRFQDAPGGGYGFIDSDDCKMRFTRDIYIHRNQMAGLQIGDEVSFTVSLSNKGEPQARNVMKREDALLLRAGQAGVLHSIDARDAASLMDENQARQFQAALRGSP